MPTPILPHQDKKPAQRQAKLAEMRSIYKYCHESLSPLAMSESMPSSEGFSPRFQFSFFSIFEKIMTNYYDVSEEFFGETPENLRLLNLASFFQRAVEEGKVQFGKDLVGDLFEKRPIIPQSVDDYDEIFIRIPKPPVMETYSENWKFAYQRVAGFNPTLIKSIHRIPENFPVTDKLFRSATGNTVSLDEALARGRVFLCDYAILDGCPNGQWQGKPKYSAAPMALFYWIGEEVGDLIPVAIQCGQKPGQAFPIFTPNDGHYWNIAKAFVQSAEGNHHESIAHLYNTHLVMEPIVLSTMRNLAETHPLHILFKPHFQFTLAINEYARTRLMGPDGVLDCLMAGNLEGTAELVKRGAAAYNFDDHCPTKIFEINGVDNTDVLPEYPYRDDTKLLWDVIHKFVSAYIRLYYNTDAQVVNDPEIQNWIREITCKDAGRLKGFKLNEKGQIDTLEYLIKLCSQIIFIAGPKHSALNYAQFSFMSFAPNCPLSLFGPPPTREVPETEASWLARFPPLDVALYQQEMAFILAGNRYDTFGHYPRRTFRDSKVKPLLQQLRKDLAAAEEEIEHRNCKRHRPYDLLLPSNITNSIAV